MADNDQSLYNLRYNQVTRGVEGFGGGSPMWSPLVLSADSVSSLNGLKGPLTLVAGTNVTITPAGSSITIASSGGGGGPAAYVALTNQTADITTTTLFTPLTTGVFQVSIYAVATAGTGSDSEPAMFINWTDDSQAQSANQGGITTTSGTQTQPSTLTIECVAGQPIQYAITGGTYTSFAYSFYLVITQLS